MKIPKTLFDNSWRTYRPSTPNASERYHYFVMGLDVTIFPNANNFSASVRRNGTPLPRLQARTLAELKNMVYYAHCNTPETGLNFITEPLPSGTNTSLTSNPNLIGTRGYVSSIGSSSSVSEFAAPNSISSGSATISVPTATVTGVGFATVELATDATVSASPAVIAPPSPPTNSTAPLPANNTVVESLLSMQQEVRADTPPAPAVMYSIFVSNNDNRIRVVEKDGNTTTRTVWASRELAQAFIDNLPYYSDYKRKIKHGWTCTIEQHRAWHDNVPSRLIASKVAVT